MNTGRYDSRSRRLLLLLPGLLCLAFIAVPDGARVQTLDESSIAESPLATFTVTNTADSGAGSLREAITSANASAGLDTITFNIQGAGIQFIFVPSPLPTITEPVIIDATTQPGYAGAPLIHLEGMGTGRALDITGGGSTIRGLSFTSFFAGATNGIVRLSGAGNNVITRCNFGVRSDNSRPTTASTGLLIDGSSGNRIGGSTVAERNFFVIGSEHNLVIQNGGANNRVVGNWFGTGPSGARMDSFGRDAIRILNSPNNTIGGVAGTTPGGACTGECNIITGAGSNGIFVNGSTAVGNRILANFIGLFSSGTSVNANNLGVRIDNAPGNTIGGTTQAERNVITGNNGLANIQVTGAGSTGTVITGNYIGLFTDGTSSPPVPPTADGILVNAGAGNTRIGGATPGERNVISGLFTNGIEIAGSNGNTIQGNYIGTDATGTTRSNTVGNGIGLFLANNNTIGGTQGTTLGGPCTGACNVISGNGNNGSGNGIVLRQSDANTIDGNYIGLNAAGTAPMLNGRTPDGSTFTGHAIFLVNSRSNVIGRRTTSSAPARTASLSESPNRVFCIIDRKKGYLTFTDTRTEQGYRFKAENCKTGVVRQGFGEYREELGSAIFDSFSLDAGSYAHGRVSLITGYADARIYLSDEEITFNDFDFKTIPEDCSCAPEGTQVVEGTIELAEEAGGETRDNIMSEMLVGYTASGFRLADLIPEASLKIAGDNNEIADIDIFNPGESDIEFLQGILNRYQEAYIANPRNFLPVVVEPAANPEIPNPPRITSIKRFNDGSYEIRVEISGALANTRVRPTLVAVNPFVGTADVDTQTIDPIPMSQELPLIEIDANGNGSQTYLLEGADAQIVEETCDGNYLSIMGTTFTPPRPAEGGTLRSSSRLSDPVAVPSAAFNFDGDNRTDIAVYRPPTTAGASSTWQVLSSRDGSTRQVAFGSAEDRVVAGDYNGDRKPDFAVWRPSNATWFLARPSGIPAQNFDNLAWGISSDTPAPGDYDGDGRGDLAVYRPSQGIWYIRESLSGNLFARQWGIASDRLVQADYNGDGKTELAVYRDGVWFITACASCPNRVEFFGLASDIPVPADYDGDGRDDIAVFRPSTGTWYVQRSTAGFTGVQWGLATDIPVNGDFDGDSKNDFAIWRPSTGTWWILRSSDGGVRSVQLGQNGDIPVPRFPGAP